jgi:hypothetical protein
LVLWCQFLYFLFPLVAVCLNHPCQLLFLPPSICLPSARSRFDGGISIPRALAVLRLTTRPRPRTRSPPALSASFGELSSLSCVPWKVHWRLLVCGFSPCLPCRCVRSWRGRVCSDASRDGPPHPSHAAIRRIGYDSIRCISARFDQLATDPSALLEAEYRT